MMVLFCYIAFGALVNSLLQHLSFINGLYFTVVSIETIGFGDIVPHSTGAKVFSLLYTVIGILLIGVTIMMSRETVMEAMEVGYRKRVKIMRERRKERGRRRRVEARWRHGIEWRLREMGEPVWVTDEQVRSGRAGGGGRGGGTHRSGAPGVLQHVAEWIGLYRPEIGQSHLMHGPSGMRLNLQALTLAQLEASALEAGVPLDTLLPKGFVRGRASVEVPVQHQPADNRWAQHPLARQIDNAFNPTQARTLTHARIGGMAALMTRFAVAGIHGHATTPDERDKAERDEDQNDLNDNAIGRTDSIGGLSSQVYPTAGSHHRSESGDMEKKAFVAKLTVAWSLFIIFWFVSTSST